MLNSLSHGQMSVKSLHVPSKTEKVAWTVSEGGDFINQAKIPPRISRRSVTWRLGQGKWLTLGDEMVRRCKNPRLTRPLHLPSRRCRTMTLENSLWQRNPMPD